MKNNQKGFSIIELLVVIFVVGLLGLVGWLVYDRQNTSPKTLDEVLARISTDATKVFTNAVFEPKYDWTAEATGTAFNTVDGYDYSVSGVGKGIWLAYEYSDKSETTSRLLFFKRTVPPAKNLDEVKNWVGNQLVKYGFSTSDNKTYTKDENTCNVLNDPNSLFQNKEATIETDQNTNLLEVTCFGREILKDSAAQMKPFVDEYLKANTDLIASDLTVGPLTIKSKNGAGVISSSRTAGYDIAEMVVSTNSNKQIALYYAKNTENDTDNNAGWRYVTQANDEFGFKCGDMIADPDARKALFDQVCLSENGQIKLDTNNRALQ
jgi:prepilin-type N-terminal cleavage/methylation domain-containing protein